jgi:hypothetical protein
MKSKYIDALGCLNSLVPDDKKTFNDIIAATAPTNLLEEKLNKEFDRISTFGRVRKFNKYRSKFDGSHLILEKHQVDLSGQNLRRIIKKESGKPYSFTNALPLPGHKVSRIVGVTSERPRQSRYMPSYEPDYYVADIIRRRYPFYNTYFQSKKIRVLPGAWQFGYANLVDMSCPNSTVLNLEEILAGLESRVGLEFKLPYIGIYDPTWILGQSVNPDAHSGFNTSKVLPKTRRHSTGFTKVLAHSLTCKIMGSEVPVTDKSLTRIGGREKRNSLEVGKKVSSRITCGQEDIPTLIGQSIVKRYNEGLQSRNEGFNFGGRINGRSNFRQMLKLLKVDCPEMTNANLDFSQHDCQVDEIKIVVAFA